MIGGWHKSVRSPDRIRSYVIFRLPWTHFRVIIDHEPPWRGAAVPRSFYTIKIQTDRTALELRRIGVER